MTLFTDTHAHARARYVSVKYSDVRCGGGLNERLKQAHLKVPDFQTRRFENNIAEINRARSPRRFLRVVGYSGDSQPFAFLLASIPTLLFRGSASSFLFLLLLQFSFEMYSRPVPFKVRSTRDCS